MVIFNLRPPARFFVLRHPTRSNFQPLTWTRILVEPFPTGVFFILRYTETRGALRTRTRRARGPLLGIRAELGGAVVNGGISAPGGGGNSEALTVCAPSFFFSGIVVVVGILVNVDRRELGGDDSRQDLPLYDGHVSQGIVAGRL